MASIKTGTRDINQFLRQYYILSSPRIPTAIHQYHVHKCKQGFQAFKALYAFYHLLSTHSNWIHTGLTLEPGSAHLINKEVKDLDLWMSPTEINTMTKTTTHRRRRKDRPRRSRSLRGFRAHVEQQSGNSLLCPVTRRQSDKSVARDHTQRMRFPF